MDNTDKNAILTRLINGGIFRVRDKVFIWYLSCIADGKAEHDVSGEAWQLCKQNHFLTNPTSYTGTWYPYEVFGSKNCKTRSSLEKTGLIKCIYLVNFYK